MERNQIKTIGDLFLYITENDGKPLFSYPDNNSLVEVTRSQFKEDVLAMAGTINSSTQSKRIGLLGENSYPYIVAFFAIIVCGKVPVMLDKGLDSETLGEVIRIAEATCLLYSADYKELGASFGLDAYCINDLSSQASESLKTPVETLSEDIAVIFHTSSSTGFPKVVPLTNKNIILELQSFAGCSHYEGTAFLCLPAYHVYGMIANVLHFLYIDMKIFINDSPRKMLANLKMAQPTMLSIVPMMYNLLSRAMKGEQTVEALRSVVGENLKYICFGGASFTVDPTLLLQAGIQVTIGYGLTETASSISLRHITAPTNELDNVGKAMIGVEFKIGDNNELLAKGDMIFKNYLNNDSATQAAFEGDWFRTGDTGYIDDKGEVHITGRIKNLIILPNGENVPAEKLEALLYKLPYVTECIVKEQDSKITAFIYSSEPDEAAQHIKDDLLIINSKLPLSHNITAFQFRETPFDKTSAQKIKRI